MIRFILLFAFVCSPAFAQDKLNSVTVKSTTKVQTGWVCFDEPSMKKIDVSQKRGLDCLKSLQEARNTIEMLKRENEESGVIEINEGGQPYPFYKTTGFKIVTSVIIGFGVGIVVGGAL